MPAGLLLGDSASAGALDELAAHLGHDLGVLLAHGLAQQVGFAQGEAGQHVRNPHHLFLVGDHAVGLGENRLELGQLVLDLGPALLAGDEVVHHAAAQRARAVQRVQRDQVVEPLRLGLAQDVAHAAALELEDAVGLPVLEDLVRLRIVERHAVDVELDAGGPLDLLDGVEDQRQRAEARGSPSSAGRCARSPSSTTAS